MSKMCDDTLYCVKCDMYYWNKSSCGCVILNKFKVGDKVTIKAGSIYYQDFSMFQWGDDTCCFTVKNVGGSDKLYSIYASGYGDKDNYGDGCIFIKEECLEMC